LDLLDGHRFDGTISPGGLDLTLRDRFEPNYHGMTPVSLTPASPQLATDGQLAIRELRRGLVAVIESVGGDPAVPQELSRRFRIDKTLAWRISRAVREEDAWSALQHVPGRSGLAIFQAAMQRAGAPAERLTELTDVIERFEDFVSTHARDRDTLEMIVSVPKGGTSRKRMEAFRKSGYQCNSSLLGVRATTQFTAQFLAPSHTPGMLDVGIIGGLLELCRLRPNVPWSVATVANWSAGNVATGKTATLPIVPDPSDAATPMLRDFCRPTDVRVMPVERPGGTFRYMLEPGPVGYSASSDVVYGWVDFAAVPPHSSVPGETGDHCVHLYTPSEELVFDFFAHKSLTFAHTPFVRVFSMSPGGPLYPDPAANHATLPVPTDLIDLGEGIPEPPTRSMTRYADMVEAAAARLRRPISEFRVFRYRLAFPPAPAMCCISHPLLPQP